MADTTRVGKRLLRDTDVLDLDIVRELFAAESDGVHWQTTIAQRLQRVRTDSRAADAGDVLAAIAEQHDCAHGKIRGVRDKLLQTIVNAGGGSRGRDALRAVDALDVAVEAIETRLEAILKTCEYSAVERCERGVFARTAVDVS